MKADKMEKKDLLNEPKISFIICTYNSPELIKKCLDSILNQKYNGKKEIILVDGGSEKVTIELLSDYKKKNKEIKIINNKNKLPEGFGMGKWLGWNSANGDYVFIIDQDNELVGKNFVNEMLIPFKNKEKVFGCTCRLKIGYEDNLINQYIALVGTDPFFAYRSLDGIINLNKIEEISEEKENYFLFEINKDNLIITGGNCFVYKKSLLDDVGGYTKDTENIIRLVEQNNNKVAILKNAKTHHRAVNGFLDFLRKKKKWAKVYLDKEVKDDKEVKKFSYLPKTRQERREFIKNFFIIFTIVPNIFISMKKIIQSREIAWILHAFLSFITGFIYFFYAFLRR